MSRNIERHIALFELFHQYETITLKMIENKFGSRGIKFTKSPFYRDIKFLNDIGFVIINDKNGSFTLDKDLSTNYDFLSHYFKHLAMTKMCEQATELNHDFLKYIQFERNSNAFSDFSLFSSIFNAICHKHSITFTHSSYYYKDKVESYALKPYFLKEYKNRWYVIGETKKGFRTFGLDRISELVVNGDKIPSKFEEAIEHFENTVGLNYSDHDLEIIRLSIDSSQRPYLESLPIHKTQKTYPDDNGRFELTLYVKYNFELKQELLKYGSFLKVLSPKWIQEDFKSELEKALDQY